MRTLASLTLALLLALASPAMARTWQIYPDGSGDAPTIQAGLDSAATGDTVLVMPGTYHENLFWPFRDGVVLLGGGMENTIVVGDGVETVLYMVGTSSTGGGCGEASIESALEHQKISEALSFAVPIDSTTVVNEITFRRRGDAGIVFYSASPIVESCRVDSIHHGAGVHALYGSSAQIRQCQIVSNNDGGVKLTECDSLLKISGNTITQNSASEGGGIYCYYSSPTISGNIITGNSASGEAPRGGGICYYSLPRITGNTISGNSASAYYSAYGGEIYC